MTGGRVSPYNPTAPQSRVDLRPPSMDQKQQTEDLSIGEAFRAIAHVEKNVKEVKDQVAALQIEIAGEHGELGMRALMINLTKEVESSTTKNSERVAASSERAAWALVALVLIGLVNMLLRNWPP